MYMQQIYCMHLAMQIPKLGLSSFDHMNRTTFVDLVALPKD